MSYFKEWGYVSNPFKTKPLEPDEKISELLVGRETEKKKLKNRLLSDSGIVTIEGENGIGKTSLLNACIFELYEESLTNKKEILFIPCNTIFQLSDKKDIKDFIDDIYFSLAQTFIEKIKDIKQSGLDVPKTGILDRWLNSAEVISIEGQILGCGIGGSRESITTEGFSKSGFKKTVLSLLNKVFPKSESGGVICVIDNMELLKTSEKAKATLEIIRDEIITLNGVKWFFSGSHNIFRSIVSSTRLSGFLHSPIYIDRLTDIYISSLLSSRVTSYQNHVDHKPYLPITNKSFIKLYKALNGNIRETLKKLSVYCLHVFELELEPHFDGEKELIFEKWFETDITKTFDAVSQSINTKQMKLLELIINQKNTLITKKMLFDIKIDSLKETSECIMNLNKYGLITIPISQGTEIAKFSGIEVEIVSEIENQISNKKLLNIFNDIIVSPKGHLIIDKISFINNAL